MLNTNNDEFGLNDILELVGSEEANKNITKTGTPEKKSAITPKTKVTKKETKKVTQTATTLKSKVTKKENALTTTNDLVPVRLNKETRDLVKLICNELPLYKAFDNIVKEWMKTNKDAIKQKLNGIITKFDKMD